MTVLATPDTGLTESNVSYFYNTVGETGNSANDAKVNAVDMLIARDNMASIFNDILLRAQKGGRQDT